MNRVISLRPSALDLDIHRYRLADSGNGLRPWAKEQIELAAVERIGRYAPTSFFRFLCWIQQFHVESNRFSHAMHRKIADDIATFRPSLPDASALESDLGEFLNVKELCASEVIISFFNSSVNALNLDSRRNRGALGMLAVNIDSAFESSELSMGGTEILMDIEANGRTGLVEGVNFIRSRSQACCSDENENDYCWRFHLRLWFSS
jgi:hypothetical protein